MNDYAKTLKSDESSLIVQHFYRPLAYPIAKVAHRLGFTANEVTVISGLCWIISLPVFLFYGFAAVDGVDWSGILVAVILWNLGTVLDVADGSLARLSGTASPAGFYLDYVFHLLFKPCFFGAVGFLCSFTVSNWVADTFLDTECFSTYQDIDIYLFFFALASLAPMLNWSASQSSAEHVLCELTGKGKVDSTAISPSVWLGDTDSAAPLAAKHQSGFRLIRAIAAECLSYYGQFAFFGVLVIVDFLLDHLDVNLPMSLPCTTIAFWLLYTVFLVRLPFRIASGFRRMEALVEHRQTQD